MTDTRPALLGGPAAFPDGLPLVRPTLPDIPGVSAALDEVLNSGMLTNGPNVRRLEEQAADHLGVKRVVAVSSCTSGLLLVLQALGSRGRAVLPSFTFSATAHVVHWTGGTPDWADVDAETLTLDPQQAAEACVDADLMVATHLYGTPCAVDDLQRIADDAGVPLVYDAAHAIGSRHGDTPIGGFGTAEIFSLSPTKVAVAGEGGLVATNDEALADTVRIGRDYGNPGDYDCLFPGLNARMSELHAVLALASLGALEEIVMHRNVLADRFHDRLEGLDGLTFPTVREGDRSTFKDLAMLVDGAAFGLTADQLARALKAEGIDTRRYYHPPVHMQKAYADVPPRRPLPVTMTAAEQALAVPLWSHMTEAQIDGVADAVARIGASADAVRAELA
jgi:dTDP-4-amino-4,6-dideoxygalactose transaminase